MGMSVREARASMLQRVGIFGRRRVWRQMCNLSHRTVMDSRGERSGGPVLRIPRFKAQRDSKGGSRKSDLNEGSWGFKFMGGLGAWGLRV